MQHNTEACGLLTTPPPKKQAKWKQKALFLSLKDSVYNSLYFKGEWGENHWATSLQITWKRELAPLYDWLNYTGVY